MYIVASDYTNEKADVYKSVSIDKAFKSRDDSIAFAAVSFQCFLNGMPEDEAARYEDAVKVDTESYADFADASWTHILSMLSAHRLAMVKIITCTTWCLK